MSIPAETFELPGGGRIPAAYRSLRTRSDVHVVAEVPAAPYFGERADALPMYFSTAHWKRTVEGYTSYFAPTYNFIKWRLSHFPDDGSIRFLRRFGVDTVVVKPDDSKKLPPWLGPDPRWETTPFPEGHVALRLVGAPAEPFEPPPTDEAGLFEIGRDGWSVQASRPGAERATDGDAATVWVTGRAQVAGDFFRIRFRGPVVVRRISMGLRTPLHPQSYEFAMHLAVFGKAEKGEDWEEVPFDEESAYDRLFAGLLHRPQAATFDVDIEPRTLKALELRVTKTDAFWMPWTLPEIRVYGSVSR